MVPTLKWSVALAVVLAVPPVGAFESVQGFRDAKRERIFGLVIGTNVSRDPGVKPLRYADDDAVQNANLLGELGATVVLLVDPDDESRAIFPNVQSTAPTTAAVHAGVKKLNALMDRARGQGQSPVFYLFYSGHGDVENNEGYVNLQDGKLWRSDLLKILRESRAGRNHVVIDACKSYFLVFSRGAGGSRSPVLAPLVAEEESVPPNTGVLLSTSAAADSHEWEAFQGGVFSHELRSALRGAADVNLDGHLTYEEASAFVWSANAGIPNPRFRPRFFTRPPSDDDAGEAVLLTVEADASDRLLVGPGAEDHIYVEDEQGLRLADVRPASEQRVHLLLPTRRPLFVRRVDSNKEIELPEGKQLQLARLPVKSTTASRRGAEHVAFRRLFQRPFGSESLVAFRNRPPDVFVAQKPDRDWTWVRRGVGLAGAGVGVAGGILTAVAAQEWEKVTYRTTGVERRHANIKIDNLNTGAVVCYALAGAAIATYLTWTFWPEAEVEVEVMLTHEPSARLSVRF